MTRAIYLLCANFVFINSLVVFGQANKNKLINNFDIKPIIVAEKESDKSSIGLNYLISGNLIEDNLNKGESEDMEYNPDVIISKLYVKYQSNGTILINKKNNPLNFLESSISGEYFYSSNALSMLGGIFYKYENDQDFSNKQTVFGVNITLVKYGFGGMNNYIAIKNNIGLVDPATDSIRTNVLKGELKSFYRYELEFMLNINLGFADLETFEFNYKLFNEINAPKEIKNAVLDKYELSTFRLGFKNNIYLAYSIGKLPFDKKDNYIFEIGFSYKLQN